MTTTRYTAKRAHAAAARGAAWLDKRCPTWLSEIDLSELDLKDPDACVLGQSAACIVNGSPHANYFTVLDLISSREGEQDAWSEEHGFKPPFIWESRARYEMLTIAWKELIRERLAVPA